MDYHWKSVFIPLLYKLPLNKSKKKNPTNSNAWKQTFEKWKNKWENSI